MRNRASQQRRPSPQSAGSAHATQQTPSFRQMLLAQSPSCSHAAAGPPSPTAEAQARASSWGTQAWPSSQSAPVVQATSRGTRHAPL